MLTVMSESYNCLDHVIFSGAFYHCNDFLNVGRGAQESEKRIWLVMSIPVGVHYILVCSPNRAGNAIASSAISGLRLSRVEMIFETISEGPMYVQNPSASDGQTVGSER